MTLKEVQTKLYESLKESGWADKLKTFILSDEFYNILETLNKQSNDGLRFTPIVKDMFSAFRNCPYDKLKIVMVSPGPYTQAGLADGMAFSCSKMEKPEPQLTYMLQEVDRTVYPDGHEWDKDLTRWSNQGVLLLNESLTTQVDKLHEHKDLWAPFITYLFDMLNSYNSSIVYMFAGDKAKLLHKKVSTMNYKFFTLDPMGAYYSENKEWNSGNVFNQINKIIKENYDEEIVW